MHTRHGWHPLTNMKCLKKTNLNEVTNRCNILSSKVTSQDPEIWFNEPYDLNFKLNKTKEKYEKYEDEMNAHVFDVLPE